MLSLCKKKYKYAYTKRRDLRGGGEGDATPDVVNTRKPGNRFASASLPSTPRRNVRRDRDTHAPLKWFAKNALDSYTLDGGADFYKGGSPMKRLLRANFAVISLQILPKWRFVST